MANQCHQPLTGHPSWTRLSLHPHSGCVATVFSITWDANHVRHKVKSWVSPWQILRQVYTGGLGVGIWAHTQLLPEWPILSKCWYVSEDLTYANIPTKKKEHGLHRPSLRSGNLITGTSYSCIHSTNTWVHSMYQVLIQALEIEKTKETERIGLRYNMVNGVRKYRKGKK